MSKHRIVVTFKEAQEQLSSALTEELREPLKKQERAFVAMRQLHSDSERRREELERLTQQQGEAIAGLQRHTSEMDTAFNKQKQLLERLTRLLTERTSLQHLNEQIGDRERRFQVQAFDFASQCNMSEEQWKSFINDFNRQVCDYLGERHNMIMGELSLLQKLLYLCVRQYGQLRLLEEDITSDMTLQWKRTDGGWYLELRANE